MATIHATTMAPTKLELVAGCKTFHEAG